MALLRKHGIRERTSRFTRSHLHQPSSSVIFPMAFVLSLLMALVLVSYGPGGSLGCDLSLNHGLAGTEKTLTVLDQMRRLSPRFCLQDRKDFTFPQEMVEGGQLQEAQAISVLHEMLQQSFNLFHTERSSAAWDTTLLKQLCTGLGQQLAALHHLLGESEVFSVLPTEVRGEPPHLVQESEVLLSASQHTVQRQVTAQGSSRAIADQHQGHQ